MRTFHNPIFPSGADPWITKWGELYVYTHTLGDEIRVWTSSALSRIARGQCRTVWRPPESGPTSRHIWAPELHFMEGRWYIYFAADDGDNRHHRMYALESHGSDPFGPYREAGKIADKRDRWAIDGTVLTKSDGSRYWIWSGWEGKEDVQQNLYIAEMDSPCSVVGEGAVLSRPEREWECVGRPLVNEGPQVLVKDDRIFLAYSASGSWTDDYCLGLLATDQGSDVRRPSSWTKHPEPVFRKTESVFGPGHCSFTRSPDGSEDWILYHAARRQGSGWDRSVRMQKFGWRPDGMPDFGEPLPVGASVPVPSGE